MSDVKNENSKVKYDLEQRKVLLSASLVSVIALVSLMNQAMKSQNGNSGESRNIASSDTFINIDQGQLEWQRKLAMDLSQKSDRDPSSMGRVASPFEKLRFGFFEGKYAFQLEHGKVKAIDFVDSEFTQDRPKYITDKVKFLKEWQDLFLISFSRIEKDSEGVEQNLVREKFKLLSGTKVVGYVKFLSDVHGRAHTIKFENMN